MTPLNHALKGLQAERAAEVEKNATGASDWPDYCRRKGKIQGIDAAIGRIDETKRQLQKTGDLDGED